jgi:UDP-N-acetylmuramate dehydrogenase
MDSLQRQELKALFRGELLFDFPLKELVSYKVGGPAEVVAFPRDLEDLIVLHRFVQNACIPFVVFGEGTNLLVRDDGVRGVVIKLSTGFGKMKTEQGQGDQTQVHAHAGVRLGQLIKFSLDHSLSGLEFAAGIPGSVGGAVAMNAGAYGGEIKDVIHAVRFLNSSESVSVVPREELAFSYRSLRLPHDAVILDAVFALSPGAREVIAARIQANLQTRRASQPHDFPSAGSVFKNPPGGHAGALIEAAGLKGHQVGGAAISTIHANYIVNCGGATARDILALISVVQERVRREKGITLEPEIRVVGEG